MILMNKINKNFGNLHVLKDINLEVKEGEKVVVIGPSGSGKSTLIRCMNYLEEPTSGSVSIDGYNLKDKKTLNKVRQSTAMVFQQFNLYPHMTVLDNLTIAPVKLQHVKRKEAEESGLKYLEKVGLRNKADAYPTQLSGGQQQRVAIARALANNTDILLCDEPTSALDAETTSSVLELLKEVNKKLGVTIIIITHELDVVKSICNRTAVMSNGKVVEIGEVYKVFTSPQNEFTKQLIGHTQNFEIPQEIKKTINGPVVKLVYLGEKAAEAVLSQTAENFNIKYNILHGKIEYIGSKPLGILYVNIIGNTENTKQVINELQERTYSTEVVLNA